MKTLNISMVSFFSSIVPTAQIKVERVDDDSYEWSPVSQQFISSDTERYETDGMFASQN